MQVLLNITRRQGARPQMKMSIFDSRSPGIPTEKPKGTIELTEVNDRFSRARIIKTNSPIEPIRVGDIVYSAAWSPNIPMRFALVGKIDINRDAKDDREELKRMIQEAGGVVDFDLPPPDVGKETGTLSPRIDWYVIDERQPLRDQFKARSEQSLTAEAALEKRKGEVIKEARLNGIRPMPIERLLAFLGYDMGSAVVGRSESVDAAGMRRMTGPRQRPPEAGARPAAETAKPAPRPAPEAKDEEMKDEDTPKPAAKKKAAAGKKAQTKKADEGDSEPN
jgi:hypothetical protein